ncbi:hypothetical protein EJ05DRAFT_503721 [Pseudovirgaria hyperparasitica]|uniref:Defect at low temperature protein 1 n=1 Tax=Pseudovirgaria hyperparasitica TaxID=470096 RepID=A0A6A6VYH3_9PEZI|nr:uncharacterized protein EJ05DRAFT_503721 [Pseudovirgaria hyperparasitica]KAF2754774.1 hypothetical protein EJ05DRAFT_503721 [Pseudovirgaria hyperparasitica]
MRLPRIPFFRIWYSTTYTILFLILLVLLAVIPADHIYQAIRFGSRKNAFVIAGIEVITALLAISVYATRLYTNRTVLNSIPKPYIPVEAGEVGENVRRVIARNLERSALIAWDTRPRDIRPEIQENGTTGRRLSDNERKSSRWKKRSHARPATIVPISPGDPPWGHISHPGWSRPDSEDLPELQYWMVVTELPNLIEAKAVSLAPPDLFLRGLGQPGESIPDARIVALLQRPSSMGLRDYLGRLASFNLISPPEVSAQFLAQYEYARFSTFNLTEKEFRSLMDIFADLLSGMTDLDPVLIAQIQAESDTFSSSSGTSFVAYNHSTHQSSLPDNSSAYSDGASTNSDAASPTTMRTAPSQRRDASSNYPGISRTESASTISLGSVRIHPVSERGQAESFTSSTSSIRSAQSVIRLTPSPSLGDRPFQFTFNNG